MALWGVEIKPNKPVLHSSEKSRGRLRVTQATLGTGNAVGRCLVQCNVGRRAPVYLAVLIPDKVESIHLELELDEADEVTFSVLGPRSVYLTGYYLRKDVPSHQPSDTESYGIDIENTSKPSREDDEYDYKDGFIDDTELEDSETAPVSHFRGKRILNDRRQRINQIIESDDDEDGCQLSVLKMDTPIKKPPPAVKGIHELKGDVLEDEEAGVKCETKEQKGRPLRISSEQERDDSENFLVEASSENCLESRKKTREVETIGNFPEGGDVGSNLTVKEQKTTTLNHEQCMVDNPSCSQFKATTSERKRKSKKEKSFDCCNGDVTNNEEEKKTVINDEDGAKEITSVEKTTSPNEEMIIEDIVKGDPNGKIAFIGRGLTIYCIGMLKESGFILESNIGGKPHNFILGDGQVIDGINKGLEGMRVGGKRRLTIPPSMGYGERGLEDIVQSDSWLVYEIELVMVHRFKRERREYYDSEAEADHEKNEIPFSSSANNKDSEKKRTKKAKSDEC